jgi:predicted DNA-binding transcriptional regulator AlpA
MIFPDRLLRDYEAATMLGRSRAQFRHEVSLGTLPPPIRSGKLSLWRQSEMLEIIDNLAAQRDEAAGR